MRVSEGFLKELWNNFSADDVEEILWFEEHNKGILEGVAESIQCNGMKKKQCVPVHKLKVDSIGVAGVVIMDLFMTLDTLAKPRRLTNPDKKLMRFFTVMMR